MDTFIECFRSVEIQARILYRHVEEYLGLRERYVRMEDRGTDPMSPGHHNVTDDERYGDGYEMV